MLEISGMAKNFGGVQAIRDVSLTVPQGRITSLIGPNGSGKTTLFSLVTGFHKPDAGRVTFLGTDITGMAPEEIARLGMVRTFQIVQPFAGQSVRENIAVGAHLHIASRRSALADADAIAARVGLGDRLGMDAASLTVAGRKRLEVARALATRPKMILFDEVMAGLNPSEIRDVVPVIREISNSGVTIFMIEHVMEAVMSLSDYTFVLNQGELIAQGEPEKIVADPGVIEAYLGEGMAKRIASREKQDA